ncbi:GntR family transcriptional regulator [candidate division KSB1 bacterium]|nr:GntR family transcriptional regulator [candidate division KSB1 bacterium]
MKTAAANSGPTPIYRTLVDHYRQSILTQHYPPGAQIDSINEIIHRHGVSRETAKKVLQTLRDENLIVQKPGKGSFIADLGPPSDLWGVIVPYFSSQIEHLIHHLRRQMAPLDRRLELFLDYNNWQEEIRLVGSLINARYEAVIVVPTFDESQTAAFYKRLQTGKTLVTLINHTMTGSPFPYVIQSYDLGVHRAATYLLQRGCRSIGYIKNTTWPGHNMVQQVMQETFVNHIHQADPHCTCTIIDDLDSIDSKTFSPHQVSGFFCCDDMDAVRILGRLKDKNIPIPDQVALVSYGNTDLARFFTPAITSIDPHYAKMAALTTGIIDGYRQGADVSLDQYVLQPDLVVRET